MRTSAACLVIGSVGPAVSSRHWQVAVINLKLDHRPVIVISPNSPHAVNTQVPEWGLVFANLPSISATGATSASPPLIYHQLIIIPGPRVLSSMGSEPPGPGPARWRIRFGPETRPPLPSWISPPHTPLSSSLRAPSTSPGSRPRRARPRPACRGPRFGERPRRWPAPLRWQPSSARLSYGPLLRM